MAMAGMTGCTKLPVQEIVPYVRQPEEIVPGRPLFFATAMALGGVATGLLTVFCRHTSASLLIQENAAPDVRAAAPGWLGTTRARCGCRSCCPSLGWRSTGGQRDDPRRALSGRADGGNRR